MTDQDYDFEEAAAIFLDWLHGHGFDDAVLTADAGAGLFDVDSARAIAEITTGAPPSRPNVQRLDQVSRNEAKRALYFSVRGFTTSAEEWANNVNIALFELEKETDNVVPVNTLAEELSVPPPSQQDRLLAAATRAVESLKAEVQDDHLLHGADDETAGRIRAAREAKKMRRNLFG